MQQFRFGQKAVQDIQKFQTILARYPREERLSIVRYLGLAVQAPTITGWNTGNVTSLKVKGRAAVANRRSSAVRRAA